MKKKNRIRNKSYEISVRCLREKDKFQIDHFHRLSNALTLIKIYYHYDYLKKLKKEDKKNCSKHDNDTDNDKKGGEKFIRRKINSKLIIRFVSIHH